jgi:phage tail sheath protein FI
MTEITFPGVFVEEVPTHVHSIEGVSTSTTAFLGAGPRTEKPALVTSFRDFEQTFGLQLAGFLSIAVRGFFENGGRRAYVTMSPSANPIADGLQALEAMTDDRCSLVCCPDESQLPGAAEQLVAWCERRKNMFAILQSPPPPLPLESEALPAHSSCAAIYYPWLIVANVTGHGDVTVPPCGHVAGAYARNDLERGVHRPPASLGLMGVRGLSHELSSSEADTLNARGVNTIRRVPAQGIVICGARTTSNDQEWHYVNVRRLFVFIQESIAHGTRWVVFEPNGPVLWIDMRLTLEMFLRTLWKNGALVGATPPEAFFVRCDRTTMTQADVDAGRLVALVGVALVRPAEFVILRITAQTQSYRS